MIHYTAAHLAAAALDKTAIILSPIVGVTYHMAQGDRTLGGLPQWTNMPIAALLTAILIYSLRQAVIWGQKNNKALHDTKDQQIQELKDKVRQLEAELRSKQ